MANLAKIIGDIATSAKLGNDGRRFFRFHDSTDGMSDWGHAMYVEGRPGQSVHDVNAEMQNYGGNAFEFDSGGGNVVPISSLKKDILKEYSKSYREGMLPDDLEHLFTDGGYKARDLLGAFDPEDIVGSAGAYDNPQFSQWLFENVLEPRKIDGIITQDGAVSFNEKLNKFLGTRNDDGDLPSHLKSVLPWLAGGGLAAGAMFGGGEAQATPLSPEMLAWAQGAEKAQALEEPVWNPADLLAAPIGAVGVPARAAAMALDAPVTLALNEVLEYIGNAGKNAADWWRK